MAKLCNTIIEKATAALATAKKDNDFIYHDRIPELDSLPPIPKAAIAKPIPVKGKLNEATRGMKNCKLDLGKFCILSLSEQ